MGKSTSESMRLTYSLLESPFQNFNSSRVFIAFAYKRHVRDRLRDTKTHVYWWLVFRKSTELIVKVAERDVLLRYSRLNIFTRFAYRALRKADINVGSFNEINETYP